jgi:hypothetical protein
LLAACVGPDLDTTTALACLKEMSPTSSNGCLYLHFDGVHYCFKKDPNVTLLIEQEAEAVGRNDKQVRSEIEEMIEARLAGHRNAVVWPEEPGDVPDGDPSFLIAYLPLELGGKPRTQQEAIAKDLLKKCGEKPRTYRNGLGLAIPAGDQVEILRRAVRYLIAARGVKAKAKRLNLTDEQKSQLREREATEEAAAESALLKLYTEVWLPRAEEGGIGIEKVAAGGRPLQTTLSDKKQAMIHERIVEIIATVHKKVFLTLLPGKIVDLFHLGTGKEPQAGITTGEVVEGFYSYLGFPRLMSSDAIRKAVAKGVQDGHFGYVSGPGPIAGPDGKFQVALEKVRFKVPVAEDEIDLESGFLMVPQAIPEPTPVVGPGPVAVGPGGGSPPPGVGVVPPGDPRSSPRCLRSPRCKRPWRSPSRPTAISSSRPGTPSPTSPTSPAR